MKIGIIDDRSGFMDSEKHRQKIEGRLSRLGILAATMGSLVPRLSAASEVASTNAPLLDVSPAARRSSHSPRDWGMSPQCRRMRRQRKLTAAGIGGDKR